MKIERKKSCMNKMNVIDSVVIVNRQNNPFIPANGIGLEPMQFSAKEKMCDIIKFDTHMDRRRCQ